MSTNSKKLDSIKQALNTLIPYVLFMATFFIAIGFSLSSYQKANREADHVVPRYSDVEQRIYYADNCALENDNGLCQLSYYQLPAQGFEEIVGVRDCLTDIGPKSSNTVCVRLSAEKESQVEQLKQTLLAKK